MNKELALQGFFLFINGLTEVLDYANRYLQEAQDKENKERQRSGEGRLS